jgi:hypothetical protein
MFVVFNLLIAFAIHQALATLTPFTVRPALGATPPPLAAMQTAPSEPYKIFIHSNKIIFALLNFFLTLFYFLSTDFCKLCWLEWAVLPGAGTEGLLQHDKYEFQPNLLRFLLQFNLFNHQAWNQQLH